MCEKLCLSVLIIFFSLNYSYSQDTITKRNGEGIRAKVLEVTQTELKYKRFESPDGPLYTISKSDVLMVTYKDGTKDIFNEKDPQRDTQSNLDRLKKGKKVFVVNIENAVVVHGTTALKDWGHWEISDNKEEADILIDFKLVQKGLAFICHTEIINPVTKEVILKTSGTLCYAADYGNPKKASIEQNVKQKLVPAVANFK